MLLSGAAAASFEVTNTVYASCRNSAGVPQPLVLSATAFTVTDGPLITAPPNVADYLLVVRIYDESGRLVRTLEERRLASPATIARVGDGTGRVSPGPGEAVLIVMSDGTAVSWDGRDSAGRPVPNGIYTARATTVPPPPAGEPQYSTATFTLVRPYTALIVRATLVPNPADEVAWIAVDLASSFGTLDLKVYDVAGMLVFADAMPGTARSYRWPLRNQAGVRVGAGLYLVVLEALDPTTGVRQRVVRKLAVQHRRK